MDDLLAELLACPCPRHAPVIADDPAAPTRLTCSHCATTFPVQDGIPVMLLSEATAGPNGVGVAI